MLNEYKTIKEFAQAEFIEKKSRFIGQIAPVSTAENAMKFVLEIQKKQQTATHNVYAYLLLNGQKKMSDDGEPQGTAGIQCLEVLERLGIVDVCVVATRYFGGILLGGGGLCRAYSHTASIACSAAKIVTMNAALRVEIICDYDFYGKLSYFLKDFCIIEQKSEFLENINLSFLMKESDYELFSKKIIEISNGKIIPKVVYTTFSDFIVN